jgi:phage-related protein
MTKKARPLRPLLWVASSKRDFQEFPAQVQDDLGFELYLAQTGQHPPSAKLLKGLGSGTVELVDDFDGDTYRAVYTVRFADSIYVLHAFKKKSKLRNQNAATGYRPGEEKAKGRGAGLRGAFQ